MTLREIAKKIRSGETSPSEIVRLLLEQIRRTDDKLQAYITVCEESSLKLAEAAELQLKAGHDLGVLHGIPVSIKDLYETEGIRTTCGSRLMQDYVPKKDSTVVARLKSKGAIVLGKLNTHEFALGAMSPPTKNPWDLGRIPGGSSGGSAAALAMGSAIATTGSDTGGSIRIPASFCGVVGLKPTYGRVSRAGIFPESWSLDHAGPLTKRLEDAALLLRIMAGRDELDPTSSDLPVPDYVQELETNIAGLRVGVPTNHFFEHCDCEIAKAVNAAVEVLEGLGCTKVEFEFPSISEIMAAYTTIDLCEASAYHEREIEQRAADFQPDVRLLLEQGLLIPASYYIQAQRVRAMLFAKVMSLFDHLDVIVTPSVPIVSPQVSQTIVRIDDYEESVDSAAVRYLAPFNLTGLPALSIPCGFSSKGLPIGMQIAGRAYDESTILRLGHEYENATEWHMRLPETS
ncbi:MAG: amidase [Candidatus Bathyarchaeia archaeon]|jgi:aspartyl-tRNA(Asn)/glutamyl-tRNA(Gln) amidotransferase subunit A